MAKRTRDKKTVRRRPKSGTRAKSTASRGTGTKKGRARKRATKTARRRPAATTRKPAAGVARRQSTTRKAAPSTLLTAATTVRGAVAGMVAAVTNRLPWSSSGEDAIALLENDHRRFEDLLKRGEETTERAREGRKELLNTLTGELNLHELVEEKILYPALKAHPEARDIVLEGYQEHHVADVLTRELHLLATNDEQWGAKFKVLKESLEHHIQEEEGEMFRKARGIFSRDDLQALGAQMAQMKADARRQSGE